MRVGIVGGGQLARMSAPAFHELGIDARILVEAVGVSADQVYRDTLVGRSDSLTDVRRLVYGLDSTSPQRCDVLTFEHEHVPSEIIRAVESEGFKVFPSANALQYAQNKLLMREKMQEIGVSCPKFSSISSAGELTRFIDSLPDHKCVLKTPYGGYDGKGVEIVSSASADVVKTWLETYDALLAEELVDFDFEVSALVCRSSRGEIKVYDTVESCQENGVCRYVIAPAPRLDDAECAKAQDIAMKIATELDVVGILAVEMFYRAGEFYVNELAMRPHNTGHWTLDGAVTSQFENHIRAVLGLKLGDTSRTNAENTTVMYNILGSKRNALVEAIPAALARNESAKINLYGKEIRPGRKLGHVSICAPKSPAKSLESTFEDAKWIATLFEGTH